MVSLVITYELLIIRKKPLYCSVRLRIEILYTLVSAVLLERNRLTCDDLHAVFVINRTFPSFTAPCITFPSPCGVHWWSWLFVERFDELFKPQWACAVRRIAVGRKRVWLINVGYEGRFPFRCRDIFVETNYRKWDLMCVYIRCKKSRRKMCLEINPRTFS